MKRIVFCILLAAVLSFPAAAMEIPAYRGWINDFGDVLDSSTEQQMTSLIESLERDTGAEMAVVTFADIGDEDSKMLAVDLLNRWGVGKKGKDNGLLLLLAMKQRRLEVEVGYGLEGILPDGKAVAILREFAVPLLKSGKPGDALLEVLRHYDREIRAEAAGEPSSSGAEESSRDNGRQGFPWILAGMAIVFLLPMLTSRTGLFAPKCPRCQHRLQLQKRMLRSPTRTSKGLEERIQDCPNCGYHNVDLITLPILIAAASNWGSGGWGGSSGGWGGSSGGGFGGFGGGSSGGAGGGVSW